MKVVKKNKFFILGGIITALLIVVAFLWQREEANIYIIELRENGFYPPTLSVPTGTTVTFTTRGTTRFWPASDPHPTHENYKGFDPGQPIEPDESWNFTFNESGIWKYHDHLRPYFIGEIAVQVSDFYTISKNVSLKKQNAWFDRIQNILIKKGIRPALEEVARLYDMDPEFAGACHIFLHRIGEEAYRQFIHEKDFFVTPHVSYCGYGFYHGLMEEMSSATGMLVDAKNFCMYVGEQLDNVQSDASLQCFHGIGHGLLENYAQRLSGKAAKMIKGPLKICEEISDTPQQKANCISGVFNGISLYFLYGKYGLHINTENPLGFCDEQPTEFKASCYGNLHRLAVAVAKAATTDFAGAASYLQSLYKDKPEALLSSIWYLAHTHKAVTSYLGTGDFTPVLRECMKLSERLRIECINGVVTRAVHFGRPEGEHEHAFSLCRSELFGEKERSDCFELALSLINVRYAPVIFDTICKSVDSKYQQFCRISPKP